MADRLKSRAKDARAVAGSTAIKEQKIVLRRNSNKIFGVFIDGIGLDRASRRLQRKVDLSALLKSLTTGAAAKIARYYTLLPNEDDSRHRAFLDAVSKAGLEVLSKRLPPKGIERQVSVDAEMAADMVSFALGRDDISNLSLSFASGQFSIGTQNAQSAANSFVSPHPASSEQDIHSKNIASDIDSNEKDTSSDHNRVIIVVCPSKELSYPLSLCKHFGADTISADFGKFVGGDLLKSAAKWIDLSDSQTIWK